MKIEEIIKERVKENNKLFSEQELKIIDTNIIVIKKIYLIGLINGKNLH